MTRRNPSEHYDSWCEAALADPTYTPLSEGELREMFGWTTRYGPPNCWTGTSGRAAAMIRRLILERLRLLSERELRERAL